MSNNQTQQQRCTGNLTHTCCMFVSLLTDDGKVPEIRFIPKFLDTQSKANRKSLENDTNSVAGCQRGPARAAEKLRV